MVSKLSTESLKVLDTFIRTPLTKDDVKPLRYTGIRRDGKVPTVIEVARKLDDLVIHVFGDVPELDTEAIRHSFLGHATVVERVMSPIIRPNKGKVKFALTDSHGAAYPYSWHIVVKDYNASPQAALDTLKSII